MPRKPNVSGKSRDTQELSAVQPMPSRSGAHGPRLTRPEAVPLVPSSSMITDEGRLKKVVDLSNTSVNRHLGVKLNSSRPFKSHIATVEIIIV